MIEDMEKLLKLLQILSEMNLKFEGEDGDTIYIKDMDPKIADLLIAVFEARPDELNSDPKGLRLWWD